MIFVFCLRVRIRFARQSMGYACHVILWQGSMWPMRRTRVADPAFVLLFPAAVALLNTIWYINVLRRCPRSYQAWLFAEELLMEDIQEMLGLVNVWNWTCRTNWLLLVNAALTRCCTPYVGSDRLFVYLTTRAVSNGGFGMNCKLDLSLCRISASTRLDSISQSLFDAWGTWGCSNLYVKWCRGNKTNGSQVWRALVAANWHVTLDKWAFFLKKLVWTGIWRWLLKLQETLGPESREPLFASRMKGHF